MERISETAQRTERKLKEQTAEFNILRDRVFIVAGYGIALLTAIYTIWDKINEPYTYVIAAASLIGFISIAILIYAAFTNPLDRGMDTKEMKDLIEEGMEKENLDDFFISDISYNLDSFESNRPKLKSLQNRLNYGIISQTIVSIMIGISMYLNNI